MKGREQVRDVFFIDPPAFRDGDLELVLVEQVQADHEMGFLPCYRFQMVNADSGDKMGDINLRIGYTDNARLFRGNIGFTVFEQFRGNRFAARSCRLFVPLALHHGVNPVWLTCNVDNVASMRTFEIIGAAYVETVSMPDDFPYLEHYPANARTKRRYRWDI